MISQERTAQALDVTPEKAENKQRTDTGQPRSTVLVSVLPLLHVLATVAD